VQQRGPYYVGGYCFGGNVAYEVARQLHEQGDQVAFRRFARKPAPDEHQLRPDSLVASEFCSNLFRQRPLLVEGFLSVKPEERRDILSGANPCAGSNTSGGAPPAGMSGPPRSTCRSVIDTERVPKRTQAVGNSPPRAGRSSAAALMMTRRHPGFRTALRHRCWAHSAAIRLG